MKLTRRQFAATGVSATAVAVTGFPAIAQAPIEVKFSHVVAPNTPKGKGSIKFAELAEKYTGGKAKVTVYPNSQLFKDKEEIEALQLGAVQMLAPSTAKFAPLGAKEFEAMDLPFLFADTKEYIATVNGPTGKWLMDKLTPKGITGLAFWDNGFHMVSSNTPLIKPADFQGQKFRISGSKIADQYFRTLGALPQIMAFSEVYQALQTGVVDGCENTASNYFTQKFFEVQKHITIAEHGHLQYAVIVNSKFWGGLAPDVRAGLEKAMAEATEYTNSIAADENNEAMDAMKKSGKCEFHVLDKGQRKAIEDAMKPTYAWAEKRVGKEVLELLKKTT